MNKTYGIFKFQIPSQHERLQALGLEGESTLTKKLLSHEIPKFYRSIPIPDYGDWLMTHKEHGQTFREFILSGATPVKKERDTIYLAALSYADNANMNPEFITGLLLICEAYFYGMKIKIIDKTFDLNSYKIDIKMNRDSGKLQINANQILSLLGKELPSDAYCMVAFTDQDLFNSDLEDMRFYHEEVKDISEEDEEKNMEIPNSSKNSNKKLDEKHESDLKDGGMLI